MENKPPIGIMPKHLWRKERSRVLEEAIKRYVNSNELIPTEWIGELNEFRCENGKKIGFAIMNEHYEYLYKIGETNSGYYSSSPLDMLNFEKEQDAYEIMESLIEKTALVCVFI